MNTCLLLFTYLIFFNNQQSINDIIPGPKHQAYVDILDESQADEKPILLYFTGVGCEHVDDLNKTFHQVSSIQDYIRKNYLFLELDVSDKTPLQKQEIYTSAIGSNNLIRYVGQRNADLEITVYHQNIQPYLVILNHNETVLLESKYIEDKNELLQFLQLGVTKYDE